MIETCRPPFVPKEFLSPELLKHIERKTQMNSSNELNRCWEVRREVLGKETPDTEVAKALRECLCRVYGDYSTNDTNRDIIHVALKDAHYKGANAQITLLRDAMIKILSSLYTGRGNRSLIEDTLNTHFYKHAIPATKTVKFKEPRKDIPADVTLTRTCRSMSDILNEFERLKKEQRAINESVKHWERVVLDKGEPIGAENCALCKIYMPDLCRGCPVKETTGAAGCAATPYELVRLAESRGDFDERSRRARVMLGFLKALQEAWAAKIAALEVERQHTELTHERNNFAVFIRSTDEFKAHQTIDEELNSEPRIA